MPTGCAIPSALPSGPAPARPSLGMWAAESGRRSTRSPSAGTTATPSAKALAPAGLICTLPQPPVPGFTDPIYYYPHITINANVDSAVIMGAFYTGLSYPAEYHGNLFFADFVRGFIRRLAYDPNTLAWNAVSPDFATGPSGIIGLESGPQGDLYYLLFNTEDNADSELRRIRYALGTNQHPAAVAAATPPNGPAFTYTFSSAGSYDPDGNTPLTYSWNFGDGTPLSSAANPSHTYTTAGVKTVTLIVSDALGLASAPASIKVFPGNSPASAAIVLNNLSAPARPAAYYAGDTWQFNAVNPSDDQPLPANPYAWDVVFHHRTHTHPFLSGLSGASGQFSIPTIGETDSQVWYEVVLRLTDAQGQVSTISKNLTPATTTLNFNTAPSGGVLLLDGSAFITPFSVTRVVGLQTGISAPAQQQINQIPITFLGWSNGAAPSFTFSTPATPLNLIAIYQAPFSNWLPVMSR